ncbi:MAG TPA: tetratricopeptide repeat protein [Gemmatimonadaceae bacterium]
MTVGLPGSGIGGLFYLLSAVMMPFHAIAKRLVIAVGLRADDGVTTDWSLIGRQLATAIAIIASLWTTGWLLAEFLIAHPTALGTAQTTAIGKKLPNVLRAGAVMVSLLTLGAVLLSVQIARLVVRSREVSEQSPSRTIAKIAAGLLILVSSSTAAGQATESAKAVSAQHLEVADRAFADEDTATARREYEAALAANPAATRAMYRLGQLAKSDPRKAEQYFRDYVRDEPGDAWGWIALGQTLAVQNKLGDALNAFDRAARIAPDEPEISSARGKILAARARTAPAIEIFSGGSRDSEENRATRAGGALVVPISERAVVRAAGGKRWLSGFADATVTEAGLGLTARPSPAFRLEAFGGVSRPHSTISFTDTIPPATSDTPPVTCPGSGNGNGKGGGRGRGCTGGGGTPPEGTIIHTESQSAANLFTGLIRGVVRKPGTRSLLDLRATRTLLDATPVLVINRVVRNEIAGRADIEVINRVKLRGGARTATYNATGDDNTRNALLGALAVNATDAIEVAGVFQRLAFGHATTSGYFAPKVAQLAEAATYSEFEWPNGTLLIIDAGAGAQRIQEFESAMGKWEPSYRLFTSLDIPFRPASTIHLELDSYDSRLGSDAPSLSSSWRSFAFSASVRLALR